MAVPTLILDTVDSSELDFQFGNVSKTRGGLVTGLNGDPTTAIEQCFTALNMPQFGETRSVSVPGGLTTNVVFRRLVVRAVENDTARVALIYDNINGLQPSASIIHSHSFEQSYQTDLIPGSRIPIRIDDWVNPADSKDKIKGDNVTMTFTMTMREVSVSGLKYGNPGTPGNPQFPTSGIPSFFGNNQDSNPYESSSGLCNSAPWRGLPAGYWKITGGGTDFSRYAGWYTFNLTALTRNSMDWSEIGVLVQTTTGRKIKIADADLATLLHDPYIFGIISKVPGAIRVGPYDVTSFPPLFGF